MSIHLVPALADWPRLARRPAAVKLTRGGCEWITDESIAACLCAGRLEDVSRPQTNASNHAARIASLVLLLRAGVPIDPMTLNVLPCPGARPGARVTMWFEDGSHRFRAHQYLGRPGPLPLVLRGEPRLIARAFRLGRGALTPAAGAWTSRSPRPPSS